MKAKIIEVLKDYVGCTDTNGMTTFDGVILADDIEEIADSIDRLYEQERRDAFARGVKWAQDRIHAPKMKTR